MRVKLSFVLLIVMLFCSQNSARCAVETVSNENFIKINFSKHIEELLNIAPLAENLSLELKCTDCPRDYYLNLLTSLLKPKVSGLYIDNRNKGFDILEVNLYNSTLYFESEGGSLFSRGDLYRKYDLNIFAVMKSSEGLILWQKELNNLFSEKIDWDDAKAADKNKSGLFKAALPATNRSRLWEPVVISGLLGGLVYLFFASR